MFSKLFHKDVFFPKGAREAVKSFQMSFDGYYLTQHLKEHLNSTTKDKSHDYLSQALTDCLDTLKECPQEPFEIELSKDYHFFGKPGWFVTKYCVRIPYNEHQDVVVSIRPYYDREILNYDDTKNRVVTAWLNSNEDSHQTLDSNKYCSEMEWNTAQEER